MSLPEKTVIKIIEESEILLEKKLGENRKLLLSKRTELEELERQLQSVESKFFKNEIIQICIIVGIGILIKE